MSDNINILKGELVQLYLDGGFIVEGIIEEDSDSQDIFLKTLDGTLLVSRNKISGILIPVIKEPDGFLKPTIATTAFQDIGIRDEELEQPLVYQPEENTLGSGNHYGSVLPADMLVGDEEEPPVDFVVTMTSLNNPSLFE